MPTNKLRLFIRLSRLYFLAGGIIQYLLGLGIVRYLGFNLDWRVAALGQACVTTLQLGTHYFNEYVDAPADAENPLRTPFSGGSGMLAEGKLDRRVALTAGKVCLVLLAVFVAGIYTLGHLYPAVIGVMGFALLASVYYSMPPIQLESSGWGELVTGIVVGGLVPVFAYLLQTGSLHPLMVLSVAPLTLHGIALLFAVEIPDYPHDPQHGKRNLLVRLGLKRGVWVYAALLAAALLAVPITVRYGVPMVIAYPMFLALPLVLLQFNYLRRILRGIPLNWNLFTFNGTLIFGLSSYLLAIGYWVR